MPLCAFSCRLRHVSPPGSCRASRRRRASRQIRWPVLTCSSCWKMCRLAESRGLPLCQDTGLPIFHVQMGRDRVLDFSLDDAIAEGVRIATAKIPLRPNTVDPMTRKNSGDNTGPGMPDIILDHVDGTGPEDHRLSQRSRLGEHEPGGHAQPGGRSF